MRVGILQMSYGAKEEMDATRAQAESVGIAYRGVHVGGRTREGRIVDGGSKLAREMARVSIERKYDLVVARSLVPAASVLATPWARRRFVFDADGLAADERLDFAGWSAQGFKYRMARAVESAALRQATVTMTRTHAAKEVLLARGGRERDIIVAPNGSDESRFAPLSSLERNRLRSQYGFSPNDLVVVYCGTIGPQYRPDLMAAFVGRLREVAKGEVRLVVLSSAVDQGLEIGRLAGLKPESVVARSVAPAEVAPFLGAADVGLAFREPAPSQCAVSPIKVGEYVLCGTPVVTNSGVGDLDAMLGDDLGLVAATPTAAAVQELAERFAARSFDREQVRSAGLRQFSLNVAVDGYTKGIGTALNEL
ncbi:MAG: glycosyltransferase involved in cell wall biosynthesis [Myxococcota bacterium]|jgi:glycosyltransferase involved in cell wall biosynthesis